MIRCFRPTISNTRNSKNLIIKTMFMVPLQTQPGVLNPFFVFFFLVLLEACSTMVVIIVRAFVSTNYNIFSISVPLCVKWLLMFCQVKEL